VELAAAAVTGTGPRAARASRVLPAAGELPDVVLYVVDTLRADRLGCYGYAAAETPAIDALAAHGILFENTVAQSSWTRPAVASLMTGEWGMTHGAVTLRDRLYSGVPTLAEGLQRAGYTTGAFVTNVVLRAGAPVLGKNRRMRSVRSFSRSEPGPILIDGFLPGTLSSTASSGRVNVSM
jgi:hypothetical protein